MLQKIKLLLSCFLQNFVYFVGQKIYDEKTGKLIGKALIIPWRGKIHFFMGKNRKQDTFPFVYPHFCKMKRACFWKQEIGFSIHPEPDFPNEENS